MERTWATLTRARRLTRSDTPTHNTQAHAHADTRPPMFYDNLTKYHLIAIIVLIYSYIKYRKLYLRLYYVSNETYSKMQGNRFLYNRVEE